MHTGGPDRGPHGPVEPPVHATTDHRWAWRRRIRADPRKRLIYRCGVGIAGGLLLLLAAITGPLPGPGGIPLALLGLAVWSSEFAWARRLMRWFKRQVIWARSWPRWAKAALVVVIVGGLMTSAFVAMHLSGVPRWLPGPVQDVLQQIPGLG